jgi:hypothetical protein
MATRNPGHQDTVRNRNRRVARRPSNLVLSSEDLSSGWGNAGSTDSQNVGTAPDGSNTANSINEDGSAGTHWVSRVVTGVINTAYTA